LSLFLSCGEASGDHYAGRLIEAVKSKVAPVWGMFGPEGTMAGGHALWGLEELQVMGISEAFREIPRLMRLKNAMADRVMSEMPSCVVVIDSPDYHIPLIKALRKRGYAKPVFYVSPPTAWAWRRSRASVSSRWNTFFINKGAWKVIGQAIPSSTTCRATFRAKGCWKIPTLRP